MSITKTMLLALCANLIFCSTPVFSQDADDSAMDKVPASGPSVVELRAQASQAFRDEDYQGYRRALMKLHDARPYNSTYMALLVEANALLNDKPGAYTMMLSMQQQGLAHDFNQSSNTENIRGTEAYDYVNELLVSAFEPAGDAQLMFELPAELLLATTVAWDPTRKAYLIGDAFEGAVRAVTDQGQVTKLLKSSNENGLWSIFGLAVDALNNRLWVSSSANESHQNFDPIDVGRSALFEFELDTLELVKRYPVPVDGRPHSLGGMVITGSGDIYTVDTLYPIVYRLSKGADRLQPFIASGDMVSLRGIALSDDSQRLFIADYEMGIMGIDFASNTAYKVGAPENLNLGGIEGLFYWNDHLVVTQNGNQPHRVMRLELDPAKLNIQGISALAVAQPFFDFPSFGVVRDDELVFLANSHWVRGLESPSPLRLARTSIATAPSLAEFDEEAVLQQMRERAANPVNPAPQTIPESLRRDED